jgi:hypothetical protein
MRFLRLSPRNCDPRPVLGQCSSSASITRSRRLPLLRAKAATPRASSIEQSAPSTSSTSSSTSLYPSPSPPPRVYLQVTPLEGLDLLDRGPAQLSPHAVVVLEIISSERIENGEGEKEQQVFAFDFLPREPQSPATAVALFSGRPVVATGRERRLGRVPRRRCVLVSSGGRGGEEEQGEEKGSKPHDLLDLARAKLRAWNSTPLVWRRFDCTHAAVELATELAGVEEAVARRALERASK